MTFGQVATLVVVVESDRPIQSASAQLAQTGWAINAPLIEAPTWVAAPEACNLLEQDDDHQVFYFRLKLDNSLVDGEGKAVFSVSDLDGLIKSQSLDLFFQHAPTVIEEVVFSAAKPGSDLYTNYTVSDLDGLEQVACAYNLYGEAGNLLTQAVVTGGPEGMFTNVLRFQYPIPLSLANTTLTANLTCLDELQQVFASSASVLIGPADTCVGCDTVDDATPKPTTQGGESLNMVFLGLGGLAAAVVVLTTVLRRRSMNGVDKAWGNDVFDPLVNTEDLFERETISDLFEEEVDEPSEISGDLSSESNSELGAEDTVPSIVPEGWTLEAYTSWLEGPTPDGWTDDQWTTYVEESKATLAEASSSEG